MEGGTASAIKQLKRKLLLDLPVIIGFDVLTRPIPSTRSLSSNYPCRIRNVPMYKNRSIEEIRMLALTAIRFNVTILSDNYIIAYFAD